MKAFFITVDTEGDALWDNPGINEIKTENVLWIPKFQELCEKHSFVPIWLTDYEIISDDRYVDYIKDKNKQGLCEVGIHVHAHNNPPIVSLPGETNNGGAYLIEYPGNLMQQKFVMLKKTIESRLDCKVLTHRAGRWALNEAYIQLLEECGIRYDCSVTPGLNWDKCMGITPEGHGSNYTSYTNGRQMIGLSGSIIEYPVSIYTCKKIIAPSSFEYRNVLKSFYHFIRKSKIWLRPNSDNNLNEMKYIVDMAVKNNEEYVEFMIHSSELMPGGSPSFKTAASIDALFKRMDCLFGYAKSKGFEGHTFDSWEKARKR